MGLTKLSVATACMLELSPADNQQEQGMKSSVEQGEGSTMVCYTVYGLRVLLPKKVCPDTQISAKFSHLVHGSKESQTDFIAHLSIVRNQDSILNTMAFRCTGNAF